MTSPSAAFQEFGDEFFGISTALVFLSTARFDVFDLAVVG
jgi:hypothetical protein